MLSATDAGNTLYISGDANDSVSLTATDGSWSNSGTTTADNIHYNIYSHSSNGTLVYVETDVSMI